MEDKGILLFLLSIITFFIVLYIIIKFIFIDKRSFTFEIINIPLGIFKFDKRDEYIKNNNSEKTISENSNMLNMEYESDDNHLIEEEFAKEDDNLNEVPKIEEVAYENILKTDKSDTIEILDNSSLEDKDINSHIDISIKECSIDDDKIQSEIINNNEKKENSIQINDDELLDDNDIVYWTATGRVYHTSKKCRTLSRSKVIFNGTREDSGRYQECIHCK